MPGESGEKAAAIIVNYGQEKCLPALFDSLAAQSFRPFLTVLVNNKPSAYEPPPGIHVMDMSENRGYAAALNRGIEWAIKSGATDILLLNADTRLDSDCLAKLVETDGDVVQPLILLMERPEHINVAGLAPTFLGLAYCMGYRKPRAWAGTAVREIPAASGAAMLVRAHVFERIGAFDERYFMYLEDVDLSLRARNAGFRVALNPEAVAWHSYSLRLWPRKLFWLLRGSYKIRRLLRS